MEGGALYLPAVRRVAAGALRVVGSQDLHHLAVLVLDTAGAADEVGALQAALGAAGVQALELGHRLLQEVLPLDIQGAGEGDGPLPLLGLVGVVFHGEGLALALGVILDGELHWVQHRHDPAGVQVQVLPQAILQKGVFHRGVYLRHAVALAEIPDGGGGVAPAAQAADGGHPGVVPAVYQVFLHQGAEFPLAHHRVVDAQPGKLDLPGLAGQGHVLHHPVVEGPVVLKLQGAQGVGDALHGVLEGMGVVVHGIDAPLVPSAVVAGVVDAVDHRVPHIEVAGGQVDLGPQGHAAVLELPGPHPAEQVQALLLGPVPVGALGGVGQVAPHLLHLLGGELAHVGQALLDELLGPFVHILKVVGGVVEPVLPVVAQPVDVLFDGVYVLHVLLGGVGVVHAQVADAPEALRRAEIDVNGLGVADVQVAVGLGWETGVDLHALGTAAGTHVLLDEVIDEVGGGDGVVVDFFAHCFHGSFLRDYVARPHRTGHACGFVYASLPAFSPYSPKPP